MPHRNAAALELLSVQPDGATLRSRVVDSKQSFGHPTCHGWVVALDAVAEQEFGHASQAFVITEDEIRRKPLAIAASPRALTSPISRASIAVAAADAPEAMA